MINRHLLRIKVLQVAYAFYTKDYSIEATLQELQRSIKQTRELYAKLLILPLELKLIAERKLDTLQNSVVKNSNNHNNYLEKFTSNELLEKIACSTSLHSFCRNEKITWDGQEDVLNSMFIQLQDASFFKEYINNSLTSFNKDRKFICDFYAKFINDNKIFADSIESQSIYWNDDIWFVLPLVAKSIKHTKKNAEGITFPQLYKNADDAKFSNELLIKTLELKHKNKRLIQEVSTNWEYDRIALTDRILMSMAISELLEFETIPVNVTLNEYIEISKYYSTGNSSTFINGILDKIAKKENAHKLKKGAGMIIK